MWIVSVYIKYKKIPRLIRSWKRWGHWNRLMAQHLLHAVQTDCTQIDWMKISIIIIVYGKQLIQGAWLKIEKY